MISQEKKNKLIKAFQDVSNNPLEAYYISVDTDIKGKVNKAVFIVKTETPSRETGFLFSLSRVEHYIQDLDTELLSKLQCLDRDFEVILSDRKNSEVIKTILLHYLVDLIFHLPSDTSHDDNTTGPS